MTVANRRNLKAILKVMVLSSHLLSVVVPAGAFLQSLQSFPRKPHHEADLSSFLNATSLNPYWYKLWNEISRSYKYVKSTR